MKIKTTLIMTPLNNDKRRIKEVCEQFRVDISNAMGSAELEFVPEAELCEEAFKLILVGSGGSAQAFKRIFESMSGPFFLLTTPDNNSLAAAMEELSYIQINGAKGEILHGSIDHIASRILMLKKVFDVKKKLSHMHFGVLGTPNMLICSEADTDVLLSTTGIRTTELSMDEVMKEIDKKEYPVTPAVERLFGKSFSDEEVRKALYIYGAIKRLVDLYGFNGVAVRCFDLLAPYNTSGCLALALLNEEGIYAACEADTRSLLSMTVLGELSGRPVFMANPSRIDVQSKTMVFAHCVLPLNMPESFELTTHFESGIGIAIKGYLKNDVYTLFKCRENMKAYFVQTAEFVANLNDACLCRTQVELRVPDIDSYLKHPLSNHQMIAEGDWSAIVNEFFKWA